MRTAKHGEGQLFTLWLPKKTVQFLREHCQGRGHVTMMREAILDLENRLREELEDDNF